MYQFPLMLSCDGYKLDHRRQYPKNTQEVFSNFTARGSRIPDVDGAVFFGLQYFLKRYLQESAEETFFQRELDEVTNEYQEFLDSYLGPNTIGTQHIADLWELGYLPLEFWSVPEGTLVPLRMPFFVVRNTLPEFSWLTNYFETLLSAQLWQPITSATQAFRLRRMVEHYAAQQEVDPLFLDWMFHDFSYRGLAGTEAAALSGAGHLLSFTGTDCIPAIELIKQYYHGAGLIGGSVPATEHAVMSAGGELTERQTFDHVIDLYPQGIVSIVSDTWNLWEVIQKILPSLKDKILARDGKLVIRPDSGDPVKIICGDPDAPADDPAHKGVVELLWEVFGGTVGKNGLRTLDSHIGVIYGDSITYDRGEAIIAGLGAKRFSMGNIVFGVGSYTYQYVTRDTFGMAMKATAAVIEGKEHALFKDPVTDDGLKRSAKGYIALSYGGDGAIQMTDELTRDQWQATVEADNSAYQCVWTDGEFVDEIDFAQIRNNVKDWM